MAGPTGFEPAISSVTGRRDRPTSLRALGYLSLTTGEMITVTGVIRK